MCRRSLVIDYHTHKWINDVHLDIPFHEVVLLSLAQCQKMINQRLITVVLSMVVNLAVTPAFSQSASNIGLTSEEQEYLAQKKVLRVCVDPDRLPFDGVDENGHHDGLSKDVFQIFARMLNVKMVAPKVEDWNDLMAKAKNRDCDVVSQINASDERKKFLDFTTPYFYLPLAVVTRYDRIFVEESLQGAGTRFAVIKDDIANDKLRKRYPKINLVEVKNNIEAMKMVYDGEVFGYIGAQGAVAFAIQALDLDKLAVTGSLPLRYELSVASRNDEPLLGTALEKAVLAIDPKEAQSIRDKWIAITIEKVTDYTLLWQTLGVLGTILAVSLYWIRRLTRANHKIRETLSKLDAARTQLEAQNHLLKEQSITDPLTGLYNRLKLDEDIAHEISRVQRSKSEFSIILLDIDHFKGVNDTYGHLTGDQTLKEFSTLLKDNLRASDILGRWGGEEFLIICPDSNLEGCQKLAKQLRKKISTHPFSKVGTLTASFGVATHIPGEQANTVISRADLALYAAKHQGRNRVELG